MKFTYKDFSCDTEVYKNNDNVIVKFFDQNKEHKYGQIINCVIVDPGFGYINFKLIGEGSALLSGFLDETVFNSNELINSAIDFVENITKAEDCYTPHHVCKIKINGYVEYNGEF